MAENTQFSVVLATHNAGKVVELRPTVAPLGWNLVGMGELGLPAPAETGATYRENALIKAHAAARASGLWALADDSGLEVDALDGAPGVHTADFGGWAKLLDALHDIPTAQRGARFRCVLALSNGFENHFFEGICEGTIQAQARGDGGFGYDPVFQPHGHIQTFAEMPAALKASLSHRAKALDALTTWVLATSFHAKPRT